jgi:hypothetical protein
MLTSIFIDTDLLKTTLINVERSLAYLSYGGNLNKKVVRQVIDYMINYAANFN